MLVDLPNKLVAKYWDLFKDVIRTCIPTSPRIVPDRMQRMLFAAMTGGIQCWLMVDDNNQDDLYGAAITKISVDELTGEKVLLIYALANFKAIDRPTRVRDFNTIKRIAKEWGCEYLAAYTGSKMVANSFLKANDGRGEIINYVLVETVQTKMEGK